MAWFRQLIACLWNSTLFRRRVLAVRKAIVLPALIALVLLMMSAVGRTQPTWKSFANHAGWSISYPADWSIGSCRNCKDPTAPDAFVDFFPPAKRDSDGWVMVERLASKPPETSVDAWFENISKTANLNPRLREERIMLDRLPALRVAYRTATGDEMEAVYVVSGLETFEIHFGGQRPGVPVDRLGNYATYQKMLGTFRVKR
jgi:hypothetical protein